MTKNYIFIIKNDIIEVYDKINTIPIIEYINLKIINYEYFNQLKSLKSKADRILFINTHEDNLIKELYLFIEEIKNNSLKEQDVEKKIKYFNILLNSYLSKNEDYLFKFANSIQLLDFFKIKNIIKYKIIKKTYLHLIEVYNINFIIFCINNNLIHVDKDLQEITKKLNLNQNYEKILFEKTGLFDKESLKLDLSYISDSYFINYINKLIINNNIHVGCLIKNTSIITKNILKEEKYIDYIVKNINQLFDLKKDVFEEKLNLLFKNIYIEEHYSAVIDLISFLIKNNKEDFLNELMLRSSDLDLNKEIECLLLQKQMNNF